MKKLISLPLAIIVVLLFASWGKTGHFAVGRIAEKHLSEKAKAGIRELIGDTSLAEISVYADELRMQDAYKYTTPFHYINLPLGLSRDKFNTTVVEQTQSNVYSALSKFSLDLIEPDKSHEEKVTALKMIVHLVGDLHQPMHVSRAEDQGGNTIMVSFLGKPGNLHGLWDSELIEHTGLNDIELAKKVDHANDSQISAWQQDDILTWMYESYQASSQLYRDAKKTPDFNEAYYRSHMPLVESRLEKAGIRLAGILNEAFSGGPYKIIPPPAVMELH